MDPTITTIPTGTHVYFPDDNSTVIEYPNGSTVKKTDGGIDVGGQTIIQYPDGTVITSTADGTTVEPGPNVSGPITVGPAGTITIAGSASSTGASTGDPAYHPDGSFTLIGQDGSSVTHQIDGSTVADDAATAQSATQLG
jgi:hypothetical protein